MKHGDMLDLNTFECNEVVRIINNEMRVESVYIDRKAAHEAARRIATRLDDLLLVAKARIERERGDKKYAPSVNNSLDKNSRES